MNTGVWPVNIYQQIGKNTWKLYSKFVVHL